MDDVATSRAGAPPDAVRVLTCDLRLEIVEAAELVFQVSASATAGRLLEERFEVLSDDGSSPAITELSGPHGTRTHVVLARPGSLTVAYRSDIDVRGAQSPAQAGGGSAGANSVGALEYERQVYLRPSRYCPSDHLVGFAVAEFGTGPKVGERVIAITDWIRERIGYVPGSSTVHDSAEHTLLTAAGTCRDFAHLGVALCRATGVPARFVAVYAPGLSPMDFHAVFEAFEDGRWRVHDATGLAPRSSLVRIATGRDAADTAFLAVTQGIADLRCVEVSATVGGRLPSDDPSVAVELA
ncbi:MAG: hypothetical protein JWM85_2538 [Acidimicrobiaceae bacterium]|nr:hypothetical protein [Acidimicrobiaceae bacterium]